MSTRMIIKVGGPEATPAATTNITQKLNVLFRLKVFDSCCTCRAKHRGKSAVLPHATKPHRNTWHNLLQKVNALVVLLIFAGGLLAEGFH